jgi:hypothetical protein
MGLGLMQGQSWKWAVEIEQLGERHFVRVIEDGNVSLRGFDLLPDAQRFAEGERQRMNLPLVVHRHR